MTTRAVEKLIERYVTALGLDANVTVHSLRVTALTTARERGIGHHRFAGFCRTRRSPDHPHLYPLTRPPQQKPGLCAEILPHLRSDHPRSNAEHCELNNRHIAA